MKFKTIELNKFQKLYAIINSLYLIKVLINFYSRFMMSLCILFIPQLTYLFSFYNKLPRINSKIKYTKNPLDDFILKDVRLKTYKKKKIKEEVLVFFKRETPEFRKYQYKSIKKFLVNWEGSKKGKNIFFSTGSNAGVSMYVRKRQLPCFFVDPFYYDKNKRPYIIKENVKKNVHVQSLAGHNFKIKLDSNDIEFIKKDDKSKIFFMNHKINYNCPTEPNPGSGTQIIIALLKIYEKVSVFGLDLYQKNKISEKSFFKSVLSFSDHSKYIFHHNNHMENMMYQYLYIARLSDNKNFKVHGNIAQINQQKKLIKNLSKIIYK